MKLTRRGLFGALFGLGAGCAPIPVAAEPAAPVGRFMRGVADEVDAMLAQHLRHIDRMTFGVTRVTHIDRERGIVTLGSFDA